MTKLRLIETVEPKEGIVEPSLKLCINCRGFRKNGSLNRHAYCLPFSSRSPVDGSLDFQFCIVARNHEHLCGAEGKGYVPLPPPKWKRRWLKKH